MRFLQQLTIQSELDMTVQGNNVKIGAAIAAIDTGTTLIGGPSADVKNIWAAVPNSQPMNGLMEGFYSFRMQLAMTLILICIMLIFDHYIACSTEVQVSLSFGGNTWPISAADMNNGAASYDINNNPEQCVGSIFDLGQVSSAGGMGENPNWIIGDTFLVRNHASRAAYTAN